MQDETAGRSAAAICIDSWREWIREVLSGEDAGIDAFLRLIGAPLSVDDVVEGPRGYAPNDAGKDCEGVCRDAVLLMLAGSNAARMRIADQCAHHTAPASEWVVDKAIAGRISEIGVDPAAFSLLCQWGMSIVTVETGPYGGTMIECQKVKETDGVITVHLAIMDEDVVWETASQEVTLRNVSLSQAVTMQVEGRSLDEVVETRLTRGCGLAIESCDVREDEGMTDLVLAEGAMVPLLETPMPKSASHRE